jgi:hypothetical protein
MSDLASLLEKVRSAKGADRDIIDTQAWADAVRAQHDGYPLWTYLDNDPRWIARTRALLIAYLTALITQETPNGN